MSYIPRIHTVNEQTCYCKHAEGLKSVGGEAASVNGEAVNFIISSISSLTICTYYLKKTFLKKSQFIQNTF